MSQSFVLSLLTQAIIMAMLVSAPMLLTGLVVGVIVALIQTITSIQEQTLSFAPKAFAVGLVIILVTPWILSTGVSYFVRIYSQIPNIVGP